MNTEMDAMESDIKLVRLERKRIKEKRKRIKEKNKKEQEVELRRKLRMNPQFPLKLEGSGLQCTLCQTGVITSWTSALCHIRGSKHKKKKVVLSAGTKKMKESDEVNFKRKYEEDVGLRSYSKIKKLKKDLSIGQVASQVASGTVMNEVIPHSHIKKETDENYEAHSILMAIKEESLDIAEEKKEMKMNNNISFQAEVQSLISKERAKLEPRPHVEKINMSHDVDKVPNKVDEEEDVQRLHGNVANSVKAALGKYYLKSDKLQSKAV